MLPGGPGLGAAYMRDQAELFADTLESYLIDPHGSGRSTPPREASAYSPEGHAAFYDEVRQALGLGDVMLLGHSFGATTALTYAALFPERVIGCIAVAAFGIGPDTGTAAASAAEAEYERALVRHAGAEWYSEARPVIDEWTERVLATDDPHEVEGMLRLGVSDHLAHPCRRRRTRLPVRARAGSADLRGDPWCPAGDHPRLRALPHLGSPRGLQRRCPAVPGCLAAAARSRGQRATIARCRRRSRVGD